MILNFANCDMVGHTGVFDAAVKAVEAVDTAVDQVVSAVLKAGGCAFITADHGNAEKMMNRTVPPSPHTPPTWCPLWLLLRRCEAARGRLSGRYRSHHAAVYRSARAC